MEDTQVLLKERLKGIEDQNVRDAVAHAEQHAEHSGLLSLSTSSSRGLGRLPY